MRENEFEHQVHQKMGEFKLSPSEEVWIEVERRIREEKKKRFIFWWPIIFLLVGGGIAFGILLTIKKEKNEIITAKKSTGKLLSSSSEKIPVQDPVNNSIHSGNNDTATNVNLTAIVKESTTEKIITPVLSTSNLTPVDRMKETQTNVKIKKENGQKEHIKGIVNSKKPIINPERDTAVSETVSLKLSAPAKDSTNANDIAVVVKQKLVDNKMPEQEPAKQQEQQPANQLADSIVQEQIKKPAEKKVKKWDWGFTFSTGQSSVVNGLLFSKAFSNADALALQTTSPANLYRSSSATIRPSFSWAGGVYLKQIISKKLNINVGLNYSYLSTKTKVGNRVDSLRVINNSNSSGLSVNRFYRSASTKSYTNQYHFINLSGDLAWRIINGKKVQLYWENGFSYSLLVGSSMLHYDWSLPGYYKDNSLLTKNHLFFTTGLSMPIGKRVVLNPFVSISLTRVLKNADSVKNNYRNFGIRIRFLMNKK